MSRIALKWIAALPLAGLLAACATVPQNSARVDQGAIIDFNTCARPEYPRDDLLARHTGTVKMTFLVGSDGAVRDSHLVQSSGHQGLDRMALVSLSRCHFRPARKNGQPVQAWTDVQYIWTIVDR